MYPNLEAEIARLRLTNKDCASICGISEKTFSNKRTGQTEFVLSEMKALQSSFANCTLEYLFKEDDGEKGGA
ncbi:MAG: XRE family transcriptional regulator [Acidaminococcaceae bacterium]